MMVGGNIKWETRTITTAIALRRARATSPWASPWGSCSLFFSFVLNVCLSVVKRRARQ